MTNTQNYVTVREIARSCGLSSGTIRKWANEGLFPATKPGGKILVDQEGFKRFIENNRLKASQNEHTRAILIDLFKQKRPA